MTQKDLPIYEETEEERNYALKLAEIENRPLNRKERRLLRAIKHREKNQ